MVVSVAGLKLQVGPSGSHSRLGCSYVTRIIVNRAPNTITKPNPNHAVLFTSMQKQITRVWSFASDSNQNIEYQTLQYADGTTSCNCKGWTRRVAADGSRTCKHTRLIDMGTADCQRIKAARPHTITNKINNTTYHMPKITSSKSPNSDIANSQSDKSTRRQCNDRED